MSLTVSPAAQMHIRWHTTAKKLNLRRIFKLIEEMILWRYKLNNFTKRGKNTSTGTSLCYKSRCDVPTNTNEYETSYAPWNSATKCKKN